MWRMLQQDTLQDVVIATGQSHTLQDFCDAAFAAVGLRAEDHVRTSQVFERPSDIIYSKGNPRLAAQLLDWTPKMSMPHVVEAMVRAAWDAN